NEPLPATLFEPVFPKTTRRVEVEAEQRQWGARLGRGLARRSFGDRTIVLRDLQVNAAGDLFLLYTIGKFPGDTTRDWSVEVADDLGTHYRPSGYLLQPFAQAQPPQLPNGYVFNGEKPEGDWWVPLEAVRAWKPRRFKVTFHVALTNSRGQDHAAPPARPVGVAFTIRLERPESALVPAYM